MDDGVRKRMDLEPDAVIDIEMEIVGFIDEEGKIAMAFRCETDTSNYATGIGLLEQAKSTLLREWEER